MAFLNSPVGSPQIGGGFYQQSVNQGIADYGDVMKGYADAIGAQQGAQNQIQGGYGALQGQVAGTLGFGGTPWGIAAPAAQSIADVYAQRQGATTQGLINSGLGNSTVLGSMQRGNALDAQKAYAGLGANLAQTYAGYQSNLGLAGLNQQAQGAAQQNQTRLAQLGYMGGRYNEGFAPIPGYYSGGGGGGGGGGVTNSSFYDKDPFGIMAGYGPNKRANLDWLTLANEGGPLSPGGGGGGGYGGGGYAGGGYANNYGPQAVPDLNYDQYDPGNLGAAIGAQETSGFGGYGGYSDDWEE